MLRDALESMCWQHCPRGTRKGKPILFATLSSDVQAFAMLGWENPRYLTDDEAEYMCCEVEGCYEFSVMGTHWEHLYLRLCSDHGKLAFHSQPMLPIKQRAIDREKTRLPDGRLPKEAA